jgi:hypothetical protein
VSRPFFSGQPLRLGVAAALAALLLGCVQPRNITAGMAEGAVLSGLGEPTARYPAQGGGQRLQYSSEPFGQTVYNIDVDAEGRVQRSEQALRESLFAQRIQPNTWTRADVLREYGKPAYTIGVNNFRGDILVWRYVDGQTWRLLFIDVDPAGVVRGWSVGDEPLPNDSP